ncbi:MAG: 2Fe-2S iron-sulfur cluster binding domain-containing protein [Alphaproteobacteria bacterium]|nr:2Fe-2S iron-sulfur cluster binding domain-containing protein [Alphaproteobacteria bacterium]
MKLTFENRDYLLNPGETVLDCLLRHEQAISHSCQAGACQSCMLRLVEGEVSDEAQIGLKDTLKVRGCFLSCQCVPEGEMKLVRADGDDLCIEAAIQEKGYLNHNTMILRLKSSAAIEECKPGQYFTLITPDNVDRCYSIANDPSVDGFVEFHVRLIPNGAMCEWLKNTAQVGMSVKLRGPAGECFYVGDQDKSYPLVLAGTGTGLAPLYGIVRDALQQGHVGPMILYHGALVEKDLYLVAELNALAGQYKNFSYRPCVLRGEAGQFYTAGHIEDVVLQELPEDKAATRLYLCGAMEFVASLRKKAFLHGLSSRLICSDSFT